MRGPTIGEQRVSLSGETSESRRQNRMETRPGRLFEFSIELSLFVTTTVVSHSQVIAAGRKKETIKKVQKSPQSKRGEHRGNLGARIESAAESTGKRRGSGLCLSKTVSQQGYRRRCADSCDEWKWKVVKEKLERERGQAI